MAGFDFDKIDLSSANNEAITELGETLWQFTSIRSQEDVDITEKYRASVDALEESLNPEQQKWFRAYREMVADELRLAEQRQFVFGFKLAMRLALESMK